MADTISQNPKSPKSTSNNANQSKFLTHFLYKSALLTLFLVLLPLFPFQAPDFITQTVNTRSWELFQLIFVGIAVSYGLFSKKNDESESSKLDSTQSYVSKLLQVSSVFDDESENPTEIDESKVQTWSSQYYREEPVVVVSKQNPIVKKENGVVSSRIGEIKPLLLPVRSLKQRVSEGSEMGFVDDDDSGGKIGLVSRSNSNSSSKRFDRNISSKSRNGEFGGVNSQKFEEIADENVVLRSPIPWRSKSGRMEMEGNGEIPKSNRPENRSFRQNSGRMEMEGNGEIPKLNRSENRSFRQNSGRMEMEGNGEIPKLNRSENRSFKQSSGRMEMEENEEIPKLNRSENRSFRQNSKSFSYESQSKSSEDVVRKKKISSTPPAPPPPPPPRFFHKSSSSVMVNAVSPEKKFIRSVRSMPEEELSDSETEEPMNFGLDLKSARVQNDGSQLGKSVRTFRSTSEPFMEVEKKSTDYEKKGYTNGETINEKIPFAETRTYMNFAEEVKKDMENSDEDSDLEAETEGDKVEETTTDNNANDVGPDVDKKADEFIAKFREQIRLQRIDSIRRSTAQRAEKSLR